MAEKNWTKIGAMIGFVGLITGLIMGIWATPVHQLLPKLQNILVILLYYFWVFYIFPVSKG